MEHFADKDPEYFLKGIEMLVHRCEKCVEVKGDYIANSKVVSFLSPFKVGQAGNLWTLPRISHKRGQGVSAGPSSGAAVLP